MFKIPIEIYVFESFSSVLCLRHVRLIAEDCIADVFLWILGYSPEYLFCKIPLWAATSTYRSSKLKNTQVNYQGVHS